MDQADADFCDFVRTYLPASPVPSVPEIRLHRAGPHSGLRRWLDQAGVRKPPYWAHPWGGGLALARFLLDEPSWVAGRSVIDLGTGSGLVAIAAARAGAAHVTAIDIDPCAVAAAQLNATLNGVAITPIAADLLLGPPPPATVILVGDLFYAPATARRATRYLERCVAAGRTVLVGDPGRAHLPLARLEPLRCDPTPDFGAGSGTVSTVYSFRLRRPAPVTGGRRCGSSG